MNSSTVSEVIYFCCYFLPKKKSNNSNSGCLRQLLEAFVCLVYSKCWSSLTHINLLCKDHQSSDNLLYFSNLFSVKHIKQILVKHSIRKGEGLENIFPLWNALHFLEFLMKHRCLRVPTRMVSQDHTDPLLISKTCASIPSIKMYCFLLLSEFNWVCKRQSIQGGKWTY